MTKYKIKICEIKGSFKDQLREIEIPDEIPDDAIPIGFNIIIKNKNTGEEYPDWYFYTMLFDPEPDGRHEWIDSDHTEFISNHGNLMRRYQVKTRIYYMFQDRNK